MALKVITNYTPDAGLKVTNNIGLAGTYNPTGTFNDQLSATNAGVKQASPQVSAPVTYSQPAARTSDYVSQQQAAAFAVQNDKALAERAVEKRRLVDAKNNEINQGQQGFIKKLGDKVSLGDIRRQRGGRELAVKYWHENEKVWGSQIMARQRTYENKGATLKDWVMQSNSEQEYNQRVKEATDWLDAEYASITGDIKDFTQSQLELANYAETPLKGKLSTVARIGKDTITGIGSQSWNALTWTASQPQRAVNTVKNFVNPNNLRMYYGGEEKKAPQDIIGHGNNVVSTGFDQLRKSYNASKDQRTVGFSKADELARTTPHTRKIIIDGKEKTVTVNPSAFSNFRNKYGDDAVDMLLDPMNLFAGAGSASKVGKVSKTDRLLEFLGKNKVTRNAVLSGEAGLNLFRESKLGRTATKLGEEWLPRGEKAKRALTVFGEDLNKTVVDFKAAKENIYSRFAKERQIGNMAKSQFITQDAAKSAGLFAKIEDLRTKAQLLSEDFIKMLNNFSDSEVRALTRYARNGDWGAVDKIKIDKYRRGDLLKYLEDYQTKAKVLADSEGLASRAKNYLPEFTGRGYDQSARRTLFGDKYLGQGRQQLQESIVMREFVSNWDETNSYLKHLSETERTIMENARKTRRAFTAHEEDQLKLIAERKKEIDRLHKRFGSKFDAIRGAMDQTRQDAKGAITVNRRGITTNFTKQGVKNTASDIYHLPTKIWKKAVLKYNPAWYVNNTLWNVPASVSAAGADVFSEYGKILTNKKYFNEVRKTIPEGVMSKISQEVGGAGLASKIEDTSRLATFLALRKKGFTDDQALKQVNRWLFDYGTKNWERPIKGILPFWQWQKNIIRLGTTMPFHSPRSAKVYSEAYKALYQRPYNQLPTDKQEYVDPETGKKVTYDPRTFYKGKAKIGSKWYGLPSFAVNPETALQFGTNPYALTAADYLTSTDRLGNRNTDRSGASILGERFPQVNLARLYKNKNKQNTDVWFADSGNSKWAQGWDKTKSNYRLGLDENRKFYNAFKSFIGLPRAVDFNKSEFDTKKRLTYFNKEFFAVDWAAKEDVSYKDAQAEKEALAKKYGFDLQKDIYNGYWSKYDTPTTVHTKQLKSEAAKFNSPDTGYWRDYFNLPAGSKTASSQRRPYLIGKFDEWKRDHTFAKNPYYKLPKKGEINPFVLKRQESELVAKRAEGKRKYERKLAYEKALQTGDWSYFGNGNKKTGIQSKDGKWFKTAESAKAYEIGALWKEYYALDSREAKKAFIDSHPELNGGSSPQSQAEWFALRASNKAKLVAKAGKLKGFATTQSTIKNKINMSMRSSFGRKRVLKFK